MSCMTVFTKKYIGMLAVNLIKQSLHLKLVGVVCEISEIFTNLKQEQLKRHNKNAESVWICYVTDSLICLINYLVLIDVVLPRYI